MNARRIDVWTADPRSFQEARPGELMLLLDDGERRRALQFEFDADRRAYVLAHAVRRAAVAGAIGVAPSSVVFTSDEKGKPELASPRGEHVYFSHARRRDGIACAVTRSGPVGIDLESTSGAADFALLAPYMVLPDPAQRAQYLGGDVQRQFQAYWTSLEAFWKLQGVGLAGANPRVELRINANGILVLWTRGATQSSAEVQFVASPLAATIALAVPHVHQSNTTALGTAEVQVHHCNSSMEIKHLINGLAPHG